MTPIKFLFALVLSLPLYVNAQARLPRLDVDNIRLDSNTISTTNTNGHLILSPNGTGKLELPTLGASTVPYLDANKRLTSSSITPTELGYLAGASSNLQTQISAKSDAASPTFTGTVVADKIETEGITINDNITVDDNVDSTSTGSSQSVALNQPITVFTNASLTSINNFTVPLAYIGSKSQIHWVKNGKSSGTITLIENTGGTAAARIRTGTGFDLELEPNQAVMLFYDTNVSRWQVAGGSGGSSASSVPPPNGSREYIANGRAEQNTTGWAAYADSAATTPVDGTGGSPNITITRTTTAGQVRRQTASFSITKDAANRQGEGVSYDFTIDPQDAEASRAQFVQFDYAMPSNYADNDMAVFIRDLTAGADIPCRGFTGETSAPLAPIKKVASGSNGKFTCVFYPSTNVSYRLIIHQSSTSALGYSLYLDSVHAGPDTPSPTPFVTPWVTETCTSTWTTNVTHTCKTRRVGNEKEVQHYIAVGGQPDNVALQLVVPGGLTIDTSQWASVNRPAIGIGQGLDASPAGALVFAVNGLTSSATNVEVVYQSTTAGGVSGVNRTLPITWASSDFVNFTYHVPIVGWAASNMLSTTEVNLQNPANAPLTTNNSASPKQPANTGQYHSLSSNSLALPPGTWDLYCNGLFASSGGSPVYSSYGVEFYGANGGDSGTVPAAVSTLSGVTVLSPSPASGNNFFYATPTGGTVMAPKMKIKTTAASTTVYCVSGSNQTTSANARVTVYASAEKQPDFSVFGTYSRDRVERARVAYGSACSASPCTINNQSNSWLTSVTRSGTGSYTFNFTGFTDIPTCNVNVGGGNFYVVVTGQTASTLAIDTRVTNTTSNSDAANMNVICMGPQ